MTDTSYLTPRGDTMDPYHHIRQERAARVLDAACGLVETEGLAAFSRSRVAAYAQVAPATVSNAFGNMQALRDAVMRRAADQPILSVLAQGLAMRDPIAMAAPEPVRQAALASLT